MTDLTQIYCRYRRQFFILILSVALFGCQPPTEPTAPASPTSAATETPAPSATIEPTPTAEPTEAPQPTPTTFVSQTYDGPLALQAAELSPGDCQQNLSFGLPSEGLTKIAFVPTGICFNGEIDLFESGDRLYVVQSAGWLAAFTITDVTDPANPEVLGVWDWQPDTFTADVKTFRQGDRWYLVLGLEDTGLGSGQRTRPCGIVIVDVTDPQAPTIVGNYHGGRLGSDEWCDVHTTQVDTDENGDGNFINGCL